MTTLFMDGFGRHWWLPVLAYWFVVAGLRLRSLHNRAF